MLITNTPNNELHVFNNDGEEIVKIDETGVVKPDVSGGSSGGGEVGPNIGTTHITISASDAIPLFSGEEITATVTGIAGGGGPQPSMLNCVIETGSVGDILFFLHPMSMGYYGGGLYVNNKLYYVVCDVDVGVANPTTASLWTYEIS